MPMTIEQIEAEVLKLPEQTQSELLGRLMRNLVDSLVIDTSVAEAWVQEVIRRDTEMELGSVTGIPAEEVFNELRSQGR